MKTLLLIDANSMVHRAFHALPPMTGPGGDPSNALYGLSSVILKLWREERPEYAAACFDRPEPTFRDLEFAEYKGKRPPTSDELIPQIIAARELFPQFGISTFEEPGFEADDLIGTLACKFGDEEDLRIVILTGDRDTLQLVRGEKTVVRTPQKGVSETLTYDEALVKEKYGILPAQMVDYKALVGDTSDNIKGVAGIGPKTAAGILQKYGTLEEALKHMDEKPAARLLGQEEVAKKSKWLVTLKCDIPVGVERLDELAVAADDEKILDYFETMGFSSLAKRLLGGEAKPAVKPKKQAAPESQGRMF